MKSSARCAGPCQQAHGVVHDEGGEDGDAEQQVVDLEVVQILLHAPGGLRGMEANGANVRGRGTHLRAFSSLE